MHILELYVLYYERICKENIQKCTVLNLCMMECYLQCNTVNKKVKFMGKFNIIFVSCLNIFLRLRHKNKKHITGYSVWLSSQTNKLSLNPTLENHFYVICKKFLLPEMILLSFLLWFWLFKIQSYLVQLSWTLERWKLNLVHVSKIYKESLKGPLQLDKNNKGEE